MRVRPTAAEMAYLRLVTFEIRTARTAAGLSHAELAVAGFLTRAYLSVLERNPRRARRGHAAGGSAPRPA